MIGGASFGLGGLVAASLRHLQRPEGGPLACFKCAKCYSFYMIFSSALRAMGQRPLISLIVFCSIPLPAFAGSPCEVLRRFPYPDGTVPFEDRNRAASCTAFEGNWGAKEHDGCQEVHAINDSKYVPRTPKEIREKFNIKLPNSVDESLKLKGQLRDRFLVMRAKFAQSCCGTNELCQSAIKRVGYRYCKSPIDENKGDMCFEVPVYGKDQPETSSLLIALFKKTDEKMRRALSKDAQSLYDYFFSSESAPPKEETAFPYMGYVLLNEYFKTDADGTMRSAIPDSVLIHELGHACADFYQQAWALGKSKDNGYKPDPDILRTFGVMGMCQIDEASRRGWEKLFTILNMRSVFSCTEKIVSIAEGKTAGDECVNNELCPSKMLREALSNGFEILFRNPSEPASSALRCYRKRDHIHPRFGDMLDCFMQFHDQTRNELIDEVCNSAKGSGANHVK